MPRFSSYSIKTFCLITATLLLSSCGNKNTTVNYYLPDDLIASPVSSLSTDPELLLVEADHEQYLTEELEMLSRSGTWQAQGDSALPDQAQETSYDFPIVINKQVKAYLDIFQSKQKRSFGTWLERSGKYIPMFQKELREAGLPEDLAYLAMIESGFNQRAYSRAKAEIGRAHV